MRFGVVIFPGSTCDQDCLYVIRKVLGAPAVPVWHASSKLPEVDVVILPGGFSYGDYLRAGAIAATSPVMGAIRRFAQEGGLVLGICNGFQILVEAGLLPGALLPNLSTRFLCRTVHVRVENPHTPFTRAYHQGQVLRLPIAHAAGRYYAPSPLLTELETRGQVVFRYCDEAGQTTPEANPNGSVHHIAGICNERGNVLGLMPHPERSSESALGSEDGLLLFHSLLLQAEAVR
ncbi:MAG: phosphoribosylformylglycinamidine synthase subunit PurQ [Armatimonadota bacterium]|nr:phosphoribosylformylglycinamidine synthase subunit PurQ [Armatimonadota bacterium]MDR5702152.1 phosphoribosylformylglycinamidine synthase subunit PurQ [Armatimonadota bacterium]